MESLGITIFFVIVLAGIIGCGDLPSCTKYEYLGLDKLGGYYPISYALDSLQNSVVYADDYFNGMFYVNTESFGDITISFKPSREYAEGDEYQVSK